MASADTRPPAKPASARAVQKIARRGANVANRFATTNNKAARGNHTTASTRGAKRPSNNATVAAATA